MKRGTGMRYTGCIIFTALALAGCQGDLEKREMADDASCRKIIAERNDGRPTAYQECRANMMQYRNQSAVAASGDTIIVRR
jgi:hypothetical protein